MRRVAALLIGALAGVITVRLIGRRRRSREVDEPLGADGAITEADDRASQLRRKLDEARERGEESVGPAQVVEGDADEDAGTNGESEPRQEPADGTTQPVDTSELEGTTQPVDTSELEQRRARVHGRARDAAESMRNGGDSGAA